MGDFLGFEFDGIRSEELGITRVSGGDRFDEQLQPEVKDITAEVPGMDGEYYFGSTFGTRTFDIEIAYDSLTEEQFRRLRRVFGTRDIKKLVFDERPYKYYMVKIESPIELSYVCFDEPKKLKDTERNGIRRDREKDQEAVITTATEEFQATEEANTYTLSHTPVGEVSISPETVEYTVEDNVYTFVVSEDTNITIVYDYEQSPFVPAWEKVTPWKYKYKEDNTPVMQRIYKGEGKISFKAYFPYAKSVYKVLPSTEEESDWAVSSGILTAAQYNGIDTYDNGIIRIYNAGDINTGFRLYCPGISNELQITYTISGETIAALVINAFTVETGDNGFIIDTNTGLITGVVNSTIKIAQINDQTGEVEKIIDQDQPIHIDYYGNVFYTTSGHLYNKYVQRGSFFKLQPSIDSSEATITISGVTGTPQIFYDYLYF